MRNAKELFTAKAALIDILNAVLQTNFEMLLPKT